MATHHVVPIEVNQRSLRKSQWEKLTKQNPKRWRRTPVVTIAHLTSEKRLAAYLAGDFSSSSSGWNSKGKSVMNDHYRSFESKIEAYRYAEDLVEELRNKHWRVFYDDKPNRRVYILRLKKRVWEKKPAFAKENGGKKSDWKDFLYVGETEKTVEERYKIHTVKVGGKRHKFSSKIVHKHANGIAHDLMEELGDTLYRQAGALEKERDVALELRKRGYATWFN